MRIILINNDVSKVMPMLKPPSNKTQLSTLNPASDNAGVGQTVPRIRSQDLFRHARELDIDHGGRVYKLRITSLNRLILTA